MEQVIELVGDDGVTTVWVRLRDVHSVRAVDGRWSVAYAWGPEPRFCNVTSECGQSVLEQWRGSRDE